MNRTAFTFATCVGLIICSISSADDTKPKHSLVLADSSKQRIALLDEEGKTKWERSIGPLHDLQVLPNGNILFQDSWTHVLEVNPETDQTVWEYDCAISNGNKGKSLEVHAFQRLLNGATMIAESGVSRLIEVDPAGTLLNSMALNVKHADAHRDTRLVRKLESGNYLVCHEGEGLVREYDPTGKSVWEFEVPLFGRKPAPGHGPEAFGNQCFAAVRLSNGNTLLSTGNGHSVLEVTTEKEIVWKLTQEDLPEIELAWITSLQVMPNGNVVVNNCHAGEKNPQIVEVNRAKEVVWTFHDFERFGNSLTNNQILTTNGKPIAATAGTDR